MVHAVWQERANIHVARGRFNAEEDPSGDDGDRDDPVPCGLVLLEKQEGDEEEVEEEKGAEIGDPDCDIRLVVPHTLWRMCASGALNALLAARSRLRVCAAHNAFRAAF